MGKDQYETFDSGAGPTIPDSAKGDFAHNDSDLSDNGAEHGDVPEMPQKK